MRLLNDIYSKISIKRGEAYKKLVQIFLTDKCFSQWSNIINVPQKKTCGLQNFQKNQTRINKSVHFSGEIKAKEAIFLTLWLQDCQHVKSGIFDRRPDDFGFHPRKENKFPIFLSTFSRESKKKNSIHSLIKKFQSNFILERTVFLM